MNFEQWLTEVESLYGSPITEAKEFARYLFKRNWEPNKAAELLAQIETAVQTDKAPEIK